MQQASAIPFRRHAGTLEVCLITSARRRRWGFPKGIIDPGDTAEETALKESYEEAGIRGTLLPEPLGSYQYTKWQMQLTVDVYVLWVEEVAEDWPEATLRERIWVTPNEARQLLTRDALRRMMDDAVERLEA